MGDAEKRLRLGGSVVDPSFGVVIAPDDVRTELRPKTAALLRTLAARPGALVSKDEIVAEVWEGLAVDDDGIVQCVGEIRRALAPAGRAALRTHPRLGYSLHPDPEPAAAAPSPPPAARRSSWRATAVGVAAVAAVGAVVAATTLRAPPAPVEGAAASAPAPFERRGPTVAVLPFAALTEGERWALLARALTQDVISDLARNAWVHVLGEATGRALAADDPVEAARRLGVDYLATGSIRVEGDRARVAAALTETATGRERWSTRFEGPVAELLSLQLAASEAIVGELAARWSGPIARAEKAKARGKGVTDLTAYELVMAAGERIQGYAPEDVAAAVDLAKQAVARAPDFGEAWAKLSLWSYNLVSPETPPAEIEALWAQGDAAALEGYRVAPDSPMAIAQAASVIRWDDPARAERLVRRAAELAPNDADILAYLAFRSAHYPALGPEAIGWSDRAAALNPHAPDWHHWNRGTALMVVGRYAEAAEAYVRAPDRIVPRAGRVAALALVGEVEQARALMADLLRDAPSFTAGWLADAEGFHPDVAAVFARGLDLAATAAP
jgi:TolB-like protein/DNA-binding winged helix-turn-helix (wHTH) protein